MSGQHDLLTSFRYSAYGIRQGIKDDFEIVVALSRVAIPSRCVLAAFSGRPPAVAATSRTIRAGTIKPPTQSSVLGGDEAAIGFATTQKTLHSS